MVMSTPAVKIKRPGHKAEWSDLPARRCDNCPKIFKPKQPTQRFCSPKCRFQAAHYGPGYARLKIKIDKDLKYIQAEFARETEDLSERIRVLERLTTPAKRDSINPSTLEVKGEQM